MKSDKKISKFEYFRRILLVTIWVLLVVFVFIKRDKITLDAIVNYSPDNTIVAIIVMLLLFLIKSLSFFIYGGLLCAASGVIFPLPLAIIVNVVGSIIMCTVPYLIGRKAGSNLVNELSKKHPKLAIIRDFQKNNEFLVSFFTRIVGILPADIVSMHMGATLMDYAKYISGAIIGMLPSIVSFSIMGMKADDVTSPAFIACAAFEIILMLVSITYVLLWRKKHKK